jgi:hypothetical protein
VEEITLPRISPLAVGRCCGASGKLSLCHEVSVGEDSEHLNFRTVVDARSSRSGSRPFTLGTLIKIQDLERRACEIRIIRQ